MLYIIQSTYTVHYCTYCSLYRQYFFCLFVLILFYSIMGNKHD
jgi:hypothetical protein